MAGYIVRGPEAHYYNDSFGKQLFNSLKNGGDNIAMVDAATKETATYNQILQRTISLAHHLKQFGLTKDDTISISCENCLNFTLPIISGLYLGITIAPMNHFYLPREFIHAMNISKPKIIFCSTAVLKNILIAVREVDCVKKIIIIDDKCNEFSENVLELKNMLNLRINFVTIPLSLDHVAAILCSSGTTGQPKGVMLTHRNFNAAHGLLKHKDYGHLNSTEIGLALLPFYHAFGFLTHLCMLIENMKVIVFPRFEEVLFLSAIQDHKITVAFLVPPLVIFLSKSPLVDNYDLSSLKDIICGAAPLGKDVQDIAKKRLKFLNIRQGYGLTEATLATHIIPKHVHRSGTVGILGPRLECKVIDVKTHATLGPNEPGEICFRGAAIMKGYCGNPEETAAILSPDGWLRTGDIGYFDENEYFYIVDRFKELIKYKAYQVAPAELEGILLKHPQIKDCAVIGKPDEEAGELPLAFVVKQPNATINEQDVIEFVAENVSLQKRLRGGVKFVEAIPKNPTGKILRRILREQLKLGLHKL